MKNNIQTFIIPELLIDKVIFLFLYSLLKKIFLKKEENTKKLNNEKVNNEKDNNKKVNDFMDKINFQLIKNHEKYIKNEFSEKNMENIFDFIKSQNKLFAGDIFEALLINIFSQVFDKKKADKDETFGKYLYNDLSGINENFNFFDINKFNDNIGIEDIKNILILEKSDLTNNNYTSTKEIKHKNFFKIIQNLLFNIAEEKNKLYRRNGIYHKLLDSYTEINAQSSLYLKEIQFIRNFFISVFIYYQNKNSPLMKYIPPDNDQKEELDHNSLAYIPFSYDLRGAEISRKSCIISPIKLDPRITNVLLDNNDLQEIGMIELSKVLLFNKGIKCLSNNKSYLKSCYLEFFNHLTSIYNNSTLEELHLSDNFLTENSEEYLSKLLFHLKGLKTLNLSFNNLKSGLASSFVVLRKLYRKRLSKLENLYLSKCAMSEESFYELGELLQSKFCKLKTLCLNMNSLINNSNFLKKIKKNKSLEKLYLNQTDIGDSDINDILKIINLTNINTLYLYKTKFINFNKLLTILYRTKIIKKGSNNLDINLDEGTSLINLDLSSNEFNNKTKNHIALLTKIIEETSLSCLDISNILYEKDEIKNNTTIEYKKNIQDLIKILQNDKKEYIKCMSNLRRNNVDIERNKNEIKFIEELKNKYKENKASVIPHDDVHVLPNNKDEKIEEIFKELEYEINQVLIKEKAKCEIFLKKQAEELINKYKDKEIFLLAKKEKIKDRLVNYMKYLRDKNNSEENEKKLKRKKLILI